MKKILSSRQCLLLALAAFLFIFPSFLSLTFAYQGLSENQNVIPYTSSTSSSSISVISTITVGKHPGGIAYDNDTTNLYVPNNSSGTVSVIGSSGTTLNEVIATIRVGREPITACYDPASKDLYVVNYGSASISVISGLSLVKTVRVLPHPVAIFYDPANGDMYVTNSTTFSTTTFTYSPSTIYKINSKTLGVAKIALDVPVSVDLFYDPANSAIYTSTAFYALGSPQIIMISSSSTNALTRISLTAGSEPQVKGYNPSNQELYVSTGSSLIALTKTNTIAAALGGMQGAFLATYDPANSDLYVSNFSSGATAGNLVIITSSNTVSVLKMGVEPTFVLFDPSNSEIYVTNAGSNNTYVVSNSNIVVSKVADAQSPILSMYNPVDGDVFIVSIPKNLTSTKASVEILSSASTPAKLADLTIGKFPSSVVFDSASSCVYVPNLDSNTVSVISS